MNRDEEATVFRAKLGTGGGTRGTLGTLGAGGALGSSSGLSSWELERQILFSSAFCLGTFLRGLALGFLSEPLCGRGGSFPALALPEPPLTRASLCSSGPAPAPAADRLGDASAVPRPELRRDHGASGPLAVSRGGRFQPTEPRLDLEMGTTLRMLSLSEAVKVRTGLGAAAAAPAAPGLRRTLAGLGAPCDASLTEPLFGAVTSLPLAGLSLGRPSLQEGWLFPETGAEASPRGLEVG